MNPGEKPRRAASIECISRPSRRLVVSAGAATFAGACVSHGATTEPPDKIYKDLASPSESVHCGVSSSDGQQRITVRICRYPELGLAWLWAHARTPAGFFSYVDHLAPTAQSPTPASTTDATYADSNGSLVFRRQGPAERPLAASIEGEAMCHRKAHVGLGPGQERLRFKIKFAPGRSYTGLNPGRTEVFGQASAELDVVGKRFVFAGPAQFHEQRQARPRFDTPFSYTTLWGASAASTLLLTPRRSEGYFLEGDQSFEAKIVVLDPPSKPQRQLVVELADGRRLEGRTELVAAYTLPIYGETWRGHFLSLRLGEDVMRGNINDWLSGQLAYPSA